jgi:hypothetical protein
VSEAEFQKRITDLCDWLHLKWHHETDSRKSKKGWPDLVIAGPNHVVFVELKTEKGRVSTEQREWLDTLLNAGATVEVWRPSDWDRIQRILRRMAGAGRAGGDRMTTTKADRAALDGADTGAEQ